MNIHQVIWVIENVERLHMFMICKLKLKLMKIMFIQGLKFRKNNQVMISHFRNNIMIILNKMNTNRLVMSKTNQIITGLKNNNKILNLHRKMNCNNILGKSSKVMTHQIGYNQVCINLLMNYWISHLIIEF